MERKTERRRKCGWQVHIGSHSAALIFIVACPLIAAGAEGATEKHTIASALLKRSLTIVIDTPPEYGRTDDRYPVLYTLGGDGNVPPRLRASIRSPTAPREIPRSAQFIEAGITPPRSSRGEDTRKVGDRSMVTNDGGTIGNPERRQPTGITL